MLQLLPLQYKSRNLHQKYLLLHIQNCDKCCRYNLDIDHKSNVAEPKVIVFCAHVLLVRFLCHWLFLDPPAGGLSVDGSAPLQDQVQGGLRRRTISHRLHLLKEKEDCILRPPCKRRENVNNSHTLFSTEAVIPPYRTCRQNMVTAWRRLLFSIRSISLMGTNMSNGSEARVAPVRLTFLQKNNFETLQKELENGCPSYMNMWNVNFCP